ncbi:thiol reductant ABC exporter subunit CydD [Achromobacter anxifer]|jgi:ATP-binding cassette subfamily C protein CydD|uniref:ATP-binding/permease protein CydD n=1 Tax=Achromobacter anxifer TaxID=1287737 RepID=A0A6S7EME4_9BURK|nr:thiol reductant ABC exporter subunit CydD [Achromobacter anxifer]MDF8363883.1 thiol reductant ABC exporter subunit CydD [Achromobacter anxifer]CAB3918842.1 ATP-binding/permease protein CydD [Achromobacter anxifer]CAB5510833.1 ATP-binding/permease protein CydD [Achromobacter anxifer]
MALAKAARLPLILAGAAPLVSGALLVVQAWLLASVLDAAIVRQVPRQELLGDILGIAGLMLLRACITWAGERAGADAAERIKRHVRQSLFRRLVQKGPYWSRGQASGELASAVVDQVEALDGFFAKYLPAMAAAALLPVAFSVVLLPMDVIAGLVLLITAPLIPLFMALVGWGAQGASRRHLRAFARLSGFFADRLRGLSTLKLYGRAEAEAASVVAASDALRQRTMSVLRIAFLSSAVLEFFAALGVAGVAVYIGLTYLGFLDLRWSPLTLQAGLFCLLMAPEVYAPLRQFAAHYHDRAAALAAVSQIAVLFDGLPEEEARAGNASGARPQQTGAPAQDSSGGCVAGPGRVPARSGVGAAVAITGLNLDAPGRSQAVLSDAALTLPPGEHVALMGPSGIGKSTLIEAIARLRPFQGDIRLDGLPLQEWDEAALRERVALIGQKPQLLAGSIADNIRLGRPDASDAEVRAAAGRACVLEFADALPQGLDTPLGGRGHGLSGGQAQRVALARLFLRDPALILLDEPTAHLDEATQTRVLDEILAFAAGRSLLLATHSPAVAARLGRTLCVADGKVEEA